MAVMPAYNKVNDYYCSENNHLLNEILRGEWGFRGMTVSDWGGTNKSIETEGSDRKAIFLPTGQEEVVKALYEANNNLATVLISGGPTDLRVLEQYSPAIVQGWWNGLEGGTALAEVLWGDIAPSGKLPFTFPRQLEDSPAYAMGNFPDKASESGDLFTLMYRRDVTGLSREELQARLAALPKPESRYTEGILVGSASDDIRKSIMSEI